MKPKLLPKLIGAETEYACAMICPEHVAYPAYTSAVSLILASCDEYRPEARFSGYGYGWQIEFLRNGARLYRDHEHVEYSTPETLSARALVAAVKAGDAIVCDAVSRANEGLQDKGKRIFVVANNSDGQGHSYAGHLNVLLSRRAYDRLFRRQPHLLFSLWVPHVVTAQVYTGAGKVGCEQSRKSIPYQLSQRADFIKQVGPCLQTTYDRPLINSRDEALADSSRFARLHIINFDTNLMEFSLWLKFGTTQLVLAMLEADWVPIDLTLRDPIGSLRQVSRDLRLRAKLELQNGRHLTALEIQREILTAARRFVEERDLDAIVPESQEILQAWEETLTGLADNPFQLHRRLDWVAKLALISHHRKKHNLDWNDPVLKTLDIQYANLDRDTGLYWTVYGKTGVAERVVSDRQVSELMEVAPSDTRAYLRSLLLRKYGEHVDRVDWDLVEFRGGRNYFDLWRLKLDDPLACTLTGGATLPEGDLDWEETMRALGAEPARPLVSTTGWWSTPIGALPHG